MKISPGLDLRQKRLLALTPDMQRALAILQMNAIELTAMLQREADANPLLRISAPPLELPFSRSPSPGGLDVDDLPFAAGSADGPCLMDHVLAQMGLCGVSQAERGLALLLTDALLPAGWLAEPPEQIAARHGVPVRRLETVLEKLQRIEPTGLFARNLADCLRLQLAEAGALDAAAETVLTHLPELERGGPNALTRATGLPRASVDAVLQRLRRLDPKPGLAFSIPPVQTIRPDLLAEQNATGAWQVRLDRSILPTIAVDETLMQRLERGKPSPELRAAYGTARWLVEAVARRQRTVLNIGAALVQHQRDYLERGPGNLRPLSQRSLAEQLNLSESTVSRVVNAVFIQTPTGTLALKRFFLQSIGGDDAAEGVSAAWLCGAIRAQIDAENPRKPVSDAAIAARLSQRGLSIARRTIAKYRAQMGIPATSGRRKHLK